MDAADRTLGLSRRLGHSLNGPLLQKLSGSSAFAPIYVASALLAAALQIYTLQVFGSIFSGSYVLEDAAGGLIPYWGFLAGLYEIVFLCFVLALMGRRPRRAIWYFYIALYVTTTVLRVLGGTRLILIKELAFMVILFYLRGSVKPRQLVVVGLVVIGAGSAVGLLRGGIEDAQGLLGPFYGLVMESALNALTLNIADHVNQAGVVAAQGNPLQTALYLLLSVLPSFLRLGISEDALQALSPYQLAITGGYDTWAPVGGMSGFASISYLVQYPSLFLLGMVLAFGIWLRWSRNDGFKQILVLTMCTNAIHFWRDPADIAMKLVVQGVVICALLAFFRKRRRPRKLTTMPPRDPTSAPLPALARQAS